MMNGRTSIAILNLNVGPTGNMAPRQSFPHVGHFLVLNRPQSSACQGLIRRRFCLFAAVQRMQSCGPSYHHLLLMVSLLRLGRPHAFPEQGKLVSSPRSGFIVRLRHLAGEEENGGLPVLDVTQALRWADQMIHSDRVGIYQATSPPASCRAQLAHRACPSLTTV